MLWNRGAVHGSVIGRLPYGNSTARHRIWCRAVPWNFIILFFPHTSPLKKLGLQFWRLEGQFQNSTVIDAMDGTAWYLCCTAWHGNNLPKCHFQSIVWGMVRRQMISRRRRTRFFPFLCWVGHSLQNLKLDERVFGPYCGLSLKLCVFCSVELVHKFEIRSCDYNFPFLRIFLRL